MFVHPDTIQSLIRVGRMLYEMGLVDSHSGNLSVREGTTVAITRTGARLGYLAPEDWVHLDLERPDDQAVQIASTEWVVHRTIYQALPVVRLILHAHPVYLTTWAWFVDRFVPEDIEGQTHVPEVPILTVQPATASATLGKALVQALADYPVVVVRGHGVFAAGDAIDATLKRLVAAERSAQLAYLARMLRLALTRP